MAGHHDGGWDLLKALGTGLAGGGLLKGWEILQSWLRDRRKETSETLKVEATEKERLDRKEERLWARADEEREDLRLEVQELRKDVRALTTRVTDLETALANANSLLALKERALEAALAEVERLTHLSVEQQKEILEMQKERNDQKARVDSLAAQLAAVRKDGDALHAGDAVVLVKE